MKQWLIEWSDEVPFGDEKTSFREDFIRSVIRLPIVDDKIMIIVHSTSTRKMQKYWGTYTLKKLKQKKTLTKTKDKVFEILARQKY